MLANQQAEEVSDFRIQCHIYQTLLSIRRCTFVYQLEGLIIVIFTLLTLHLNGL